jgi:2-polyprenyl-6-methoxyphenol hydroxylase-like FAD-dependent oxidoreductase
MSRFEHAVVIGGSLGGLLAARVLSDHFRRVTILERDRVHDYPESRKGQAHTQHVHLLFAAGFQVMQHYFPDLRAALLAGGALVTRGGDAVRWYTHGGYRRPVDMGAEALVATRPFLEHLIRQRVLALPGVRLSDGAAVRRLLRTDGSGRVAGVLVDWRHEGAAGLAEMGELRGELVVDCSGRGSRLPRWLVEMGYAQPPVSTVGIDVVYATRIYRRDPQGGHGRQLVQIETEAPRERRAGAMLPVEGNRWMVTLGGIHGDCPVRDEASFGAFAAGLPAPDIANIISHAEPLSEVFTHRFARDVRRHYEKLTEAPDGLLALGDALASYNPLYGQGMTVAALEARALDRLLVASETLDGLPLRYFRRAAKVVDTPWQIAVGADFRYPQTTGEKPPGTALVNRYLTRVHRATHHDEVVSRTFLRVANLLEPPSSLFHPRLMWRVLRNGNAAGSPTSVRAARPMGARPA